MEFYLDFIGLTAMIKVCSKIANWTADLFSYKICVTLFHYAVNSR